MFLLLPLGLAPSTAVATQVLGLLVPEGIIMYVYYSHLCRCHTIENPLGIP